jgi:hypothetical protein
MIFLGTLLCLPYTSVISCFVLSSLITVLFDKWWLRLFQLHWEASVISVYHHLKKKAMKATRYFVCDTTVELYMIKFDLQNLGLF